MKNPGGWFSSELIYWLDTRGLMVEDQAFRTMEGDRALGRAVPIAERAKEIRACLPTVD
jgi:hypothetical protein